MSAPKQYLYQGELYTLKELCELKYPKANPTSLRAQINRMGVDEAMSYDSIKGEQLGKKVGQRAFKAVVQ